MQSMCVIIFQIKNLLKILVQNDITEIILKIETIFAN